MKAVVFDNSGTLVHRYRIIKDLSSGEFITNINSLDLIDKMETAALVVLQFNIDCLKKINQDMRVWDLIVDYDIGYDVSYSSMPVSDDEVDEILRNDDTIIADITEGLPILMEEVPRMELCIGSALILNVAEKRVAYTITTAGQLFENAADTVSKLQGNGIEVYIASGDRKGAIKMLAAFLDVPASHGYGSVTTEGKAGVVKSLKDKGYEVMMVGDGPNDVLAFSHADVALWHHYRNVGCRPFRGFPYHKDRPHRIRFPHRSFAVFYLVYFALWVGLLLVYQPKGGRFEV